jgi:hypothetical protein
VAVAVAVDVDRARVRVRARAVVAVAVARAVGSGKGGSGGDWCTMHRTDKVADEDDIAEDDNTMQTLAHLTLTQMTMQ